MSDLAPPFAAPFADARAIIRAALAAYQPPSRVTVADHAAANRWLNNRGGGFVGRWSHDEAPYLAEPMEALTNHDYLTVCVPGPGRSGKTAIAENWLLQSVDADPADMLWYEPTDDVVESYVKAVIADMIDQHDVLRSRLGPRPSDNSLHFKRWTSGMWSQFLAATDNNLRNKSAPRIVLDESDAVPESLGNIYDMVDLRRQTFGRESKILTVSHPDLAEGLDPDKWGRGVMQLYARSTRGVWYWPCPSCNDFSSPAPTAARVMALHYPEDAPLDEIRDAARLLCPICGSLIEDRYRRAMNIDGRWVHDGQVMAPTGEITGGPTRNDIAGFWIVGVMSPFIIGGIGALAASKVAAERALAVTNDDKPLRVFMARRMGIPYDPRRLSNQVDADTLAARAEDRPMGIVPAGVRFLTVMIDVQANRFEVLVRGWGQDGESWVIDMRRIPGDPAVSASDWDGVLTALLNTAWPLDDGSGRGMKARLIGYDSGGAPGVTQQAYAAWRRLRLRQAVRFLGKADGRDVWTVLPMKGQGGPNAPRLQVVYPTSKRKDRDARASGAEPVVQFNANAFKDDLAGQLARAEPGPWFVHHPAVLKHDWPLIPPAGDAKRHTWFEQVTAERLDHRGRWVRVRENAPNEALDLHVGTHVLADLAGLTRIKWDRPPVWAADWAANTQIVDAFTSLSADASTQPPPASVIASTAPAAADQPAKRINLFRGLAQRMR